MIVNNNPNIPFTLKVNESALRASMVVDVVVDPQNARSLDVSTMLPLIVQSP